MIIPFPHSHPFPAKHQSDVLPAKNGDVPYVASSKLIVYSRAYLQHPIHIPSNATAYPMNPQPLLNRQFPADQPKSP